MAVLRVVREGEQTPTTFNRGRKKRGKEKGGK